MQHATPQSRSCRSEINSPLLNARRTCPARCTSGTGTHPSQCAQNRSAQWRHCSRGRWHGGRQDGRALAQCWGSALRAAAGGHRQQQLTARRTCTLRCTTGSRPNRRCCAQQTACPPWWRREPASEAGQRGSGGWAAAAGGRRAGPGLPAGAGDRSVPPPDRCPPLQCRRGPLSASAPDLRPGSGDRRACRPPFAVRSSDRNQGTIGSNRKGSRGSAGPPHAVHCMSSLVEGTEGCPGWLAHNTRAFTAR